MVDMRMNPVAAKLCVQLRFNIKYTLYHFPENFVLSPNKINPNSQPQEPKHPRPQFQNPKLQYPKFPITKPQTQ